MLLVAFFFFIETRIECFDDGSRDIKNGIVINHGRDVVEGFPRFIENEHVTFRHTLCRDDLFNILDDSVPHFLIFRAQFRLLFPVVVAEFLFLCRDLRILVRGVQTAVLPFRGGSGRRRGGL